MIYIASIVCLVAGICVVLAGIFDWTGDIVKVPHTCPVCNGKGQVPLGFYSGNGHALSNSTSEKCRSCNGNGIAWQP